MEKKDQGTVQALERGLHILELLMQTRQAMGVSEIAKQQGLTLSAAFRILKTLEANGWIFQLSDDKYIPGEKLSYVTERNNFHMALSEVAYPIMQELTDQEMLPMNLVVRQERRFFILQQTRTSRYVDFVAPAGSAVPLHASAGGKILLCEMPQVLLAQFTDGITFENMTPNTICTKRGFLEELERVREQDYALDYYESLTQTCCIAVPVRSPEGEIYAALSFSGITDISSREQLQYYLPQLHQAAQRITRQLFLLREQCGAETGFQGSPNKSSAGE